MFDLPYILTHPLLRQIYRRCEELKEEALHLPEGSDRRKGAEKRIAQLEQYRLPKPDPSEQRVFQTMDDFGRVIGERSSLRRRFKPRRPGRPEKCRIAVRAALEDKLANPELTWPELSEKYGFNESKDLERQVRLLKGLLRREGISLPPVCLPGSRRSLSARVGTHNWLVPGILQVNYSGFTIECLSASIGLGGRP